MSERLRSRGRSASPRKRVPRAQSNMPPPPPPPPPDDDELARRRAARRSRSRGRAGGAPRPAAAAAAGGSKKHACPVCNEKFGEAVFESHVDLCLKQSFIRDAAKPKASTPAELGGKVAEVEQQLFNFLEVLDGCDTEVRYHHETQQHVQHLRTSITNASRRMDRMYAAGRRYRSQEIKVPGYELGDDDEPPPPPPMDVNHMSAEERAAFERFRKAESTCTMCRVAKPGSILTLEVCQHRMCRSCLALYLKRMIKNSDKVSAIHCPATAACKNVVPHWVAKTVLSEAQYEQLLESSLKSFLDEAQNLVKCPTCTFIFEPVKGAEADGVDGDGKPLSAEARKHRAENRFRCPKCTTVFCASCELVPYHNGYTCDGYKRHQLAAKCRWCDKSIDGDKNGVCDDGECQGKSKIVCQKVHPCGHPCGGVRGEKRCLPCLQCAGVADDYCSVCYVEGLSAAPSIKLRCGHVMHYVCIREKLHQRWQGARINFSFLHCGLCNQLMKHPLLSRDLKPYFKLQDAVEAAAVAKLREEGRDKDERLTDPSSRYYGKETEYAMSIYSFYPCFKCKRPYFGGANACEDAAGDDDEVLKPESLVCADCTSKSRPQKDNSKCDIHGREYITWKCRYCCSPATFYCWGSTHFCGPCHERQASGDYLTKKPLSALPQCSGGPDCKLGLDWHPPTGTEYALWCALCQ